MQKSNKIVVVCEVCGKEELKNPCDARRYKTCSLSCRGKRSSVMYTKKVSKECEVCGVPFDVKPSHFTNRYTCSDKCKYTRLRDHLNSLNGKGERSVNWGGGRTKTPAGYVLVYAPDNPMSNSRGYVREHRLIMSEKLSRYLRDDEVVHHIDGDKSNNHIDNLMLMTNAEHTSLHAKEREYERDEIGRIIKRIN